MPADTHIQPYAFVVVLNATSLEVCAVSENLLEYVGGDAGAVIGKPATDLFPSSTLDQVRKNRHRRVPFPAALPSTGPVAWGNRQVIPFFVGDLLVLEVEPVVDPPRPFDREVALRSVSEGLAAARDLPEVLDYVCAAIAELVGLDRVVVYPFEDSGPGVSGHTFNNGTLASLPHLRFQPEFFPGEEGYRLPDQESVFACVVTGTPDVPMVGDPGPAAPAITHRLGCRTPYPVPAPYPRESGVATAVRIVLSVGGKPWGVVVGAAQRTIRLDYQFRTFLHLMGTLAGQSITFHIVDRVGRHALQSDLTRSRLREFIAAAPTLVEGLTGAAPSLLEYIGGTSGAAVVVGDRLVVMGSTPPEEEVGKLLQWAGDLEEGQAIYASDQLETSYATDGRLRATAAGALLVPLNSRRTEWIAWFRPGVAARRAYSKPWTSGQLEAATELQSFVRYIVMERSSQLRRITQQLKAAHTDMEDFSYMVSHDLRAPLRAIDGFAEILLEDYGQGIDEEGRELIQVIQYNAARMNQFIADVLELSRIGRAKLIVNEIEVGPLVDEAVREVAKQEGISAKVDVAPNLPLLRGDRQQLGVVFRQLISNAVKFSAAELPPRIGVGFRRGTGRGEGEFFISDNGIGIPPLHHQRIFGMFHRLVTQEEYGGNGVGLAIVRRIIHRHNGEIRIESSTNEGATFLFYTNL